MSASLTLVSILKKELRTQGMTYAQLAQALQCSESSVKRLLARGDMPLSRVDEICHVLKMDFSELAQRVVNETPLLQTLSLAQEKAVVSDKTLLLVALCVLSQWTLEQMVSTYRLTTAQGIRCLVQLDRLGVIALRPNNRYQLRLSKAFRWQPHGPVMRYFREHAMVEYFGGDFSGENESLQLVHGSIGREMAQALVERLQRVAHDFALQHQSEQKRPAAQREGYTLVLAMRRWEFSGVASMRR